MKASQAQSWYVKRIEVPTLRWVEMGLPEVMRCVECCVQEFQGLWREWVANWRVSGREAMATKVNSVSHLVTLRQG